MFTDSLSVQGCWR